MSPSERSTGTSRSKDSLSTLTYRDRHLFPAGISIDESSWVNAPTHIKDAIRGMLDFTGTVAPQSELAEFYEATGSSHVVGAATAALRQTYSTAQTIRMDAVQLRNRPENRWTPVIVTALSDLLSDEQFHYMQDMLWNATPHPLEAAHGLPIPKPDFAVGFRCARSRLRAGLRRSPGGADTLVGNGDPFDEGYIKTLALKPGIYLRPYVNDTYFDIVFPFFCFEAKSPIGTNYAAANQLGGSLSFALGLLVQLRRLANGRNDQSLMVFGATSSGRNWEIYIAYETSAGDDDGECTLCTIWTGNIQDIARAVEFLSLVAKIRRWVHEALRPDVARWLLALSDTSSTAGHA